MTKHLLTPFACLLASLLLFGTACTSDKDYYIPPEPGPEEVEKTLTIKAMQPNQWTQEDAFVIFPNETDEIDETGYRFEFTTKQENISSDGKTADFTSKDKIEWPVTHTKYYAFYPAHRAGNDLGRSYLSMGGQVQVGNGSTKHLADYTYMAAEFTGNINNISSLSFIAKTSTLRMDIALPAEAGTPKNIKLRTGYTHFYDVYGFAIMGFYDGLYTQKVSELNLELQGITSPSFTAYMEILPCSLRGEVVCVVETEDNLYYGCTLLLSEDLIYEAGEIYELDLDKGFEEMVVFNDDTTPAAEFGGGNGTSSSPYLISTPAHLKKLEYDVNNPENSTSYENTYFRLDTDMDLNTANWRPVGMYKSRPFQGHFDGNNRVISGKMVGKADYFGVFGCVAGGEIKNLTVSADVINDVEANLQGNEPFTGGIVGCISGDFRLSNCFMSGVAAYNQIVYSPSLGGVAGGLDFIGGKNAEILNCSNSGNLFLNNSYHEAYVGGVLGVISSSTGNVRIQDCTNWGTVVTSQDSGGYGGIVGHFSAFSSGTTRVIEGCSNFGNVTVPYGLSANVGGVAGFISDVFLTGCSNEGDIVGYDCGGIVGKMEGSSSVLHANCNRGTVTGAYERSSTGGLVGVRPEKEEIFAGKVYDCNRNESTSPARWIGNMRDDFKGDSGSVVCEHP